MKHVFRLYLLQIWFGDLLCLTFVYVVSSLTLVLRNLCGSMGKLRISGKVSVICWKGKCVDSTSLKNWYILYICFSFYIQYKSQGTFGKLRWLFYVCLFLRFWWYLKQMLIIILNTWFSNIQIKHMKKTSISLLKYWI